MVANMIKNSVLKIKASILGEPSKFPAIGKTINVQNAVDSELDDSAGLFLGYGYRYNAYPYTLQNCYGEEGIIETPVVILENDFMRAVFLLDYGARLWELWDKTENRNLVYTNDCIKLRNLAIRNAWFSGGIEWNMGCIGHTVFGMEKIYCERLYDEKLGDVLRFYEFERVRECTYQMDFWLDRKSPKLYARMRIVNTSADTKPMYWWTNIASPYYEDGRIVVNADSAYKSDENGKIVKKSVPLDDGVNVFAYENIPIACDYFFKIDDECKYIANFDKNGRGLLQFSTPVQKSRKLFTWGNQNVSENWQKLLTDHAPKYLEIQAGITQTQYECIPMPQKTAWEWLEVYCGIELENYSPEGDYRIHQKMCNEKAAAHYKNTDLASLLKETKKLAHQKGILMQEGSGFGYLHNQISSEKTESHLQFKESREILELMDLVQKGDFAEKNPIERPYAFASGKGMIGLLRKAVKEHNGENWYTLYQLALALLDAEQPFEAGYYARKSLQKSANAFTYHLNAFILAEQNDEKYIDCVKKAVDCTQDYDMICSLLRLMIEKKNFAAVTELYEKLENSLKNRTRLRLYAAYSYAENNELKKAKEMFANGENIVPEDIREGESMVDELWLKLNRNGDINSIDDVPDCYRFSFKRIKKS